MLVVYDFDRNNIFLDPLNNIQVGTIKTSWSLINDTLSNDGVIPKLYLFDNEAPLELKTSITKKLINYQLVSTHIHHINYSECAIRT